ncbi:MAG: hypothetical protein K5696_13075 [Lachnospiraceae bacterium]|nr:hypothetical protein [Lachnospiraceae bacterium]
MVGVQLGWLSDALNWLFKKILNPVFEWLTDLLSTALSWVFNEILQPVLSFVFDTFIAEILQVILRAICLIFLAGMQVLLRVLDCIVGVYEIFAGIRNVTMHLPSGSSTVDTKGPLLELLYRTPFVRNATVVLIGIGFALCFLFALIAVIRSILDFDGQTGHPVSRVLRLTAQAVFKLLLIPLFGLFMITLSGVILTSINEAFSENGEEFSIPRTIFVMTTFDAIDVKKAKSESDAKAHNTSTGDQASFTDDYRKDFYNPVSSGEDLMYDTALIEQTFDVVKINYLEGYLLCLVFIVLLMAALLIFLCRIYDVLLLLIMEPLFVAPMPFDEGEHFEKWQELFIGKLFSGYGMVIAMNLYLMIAGKMFGGTFSLADPSGPFHAVEDGLIKLIFMMGGVFAVLNIGPLITSILSQTASNEEMMQGAVMTSYMSDLVLKPGAVQRQIRSMMFDPQVQTKGKVLAKPKNGGGGDGHGFSLSGKAKRGVGSIPGLNGRENVGSLGRVISPGGMAGFGGTAGYAHGFGGMGTPGDMAAMTAMLSTPQKTMKEDDSKPGERTARAALGPELTEDGLRAQEQVFGAGQAGAPQAKRGSELSATTASGSRTTDGASSATAGASGTRQTADRPAAAAGDGQAASRTGVAGGADQVGGSDQDLFGGTIPSAGSDQDLFGGTIPSAGADQDLFGGTIPSAGADQDLPGGTIPSAGSGAFSGSASSAGSGAFGGDTSSSGASDGLGGTADMTATSAAGADTGSVSSGGPTDPFMTADPLGLGSADGSAVFSAPDGTGGTGGPAGMDDSPTATDPLSMGDPLKMGANDDDKPDGGKF